MMKLQKASLIWALNHVEKFGDTDVFPMPFEYAAIRHDWAAIEDYLSTQNLLTWTTRPQRSLLSPKSRYGFRLVTQLDPLDYLIFTSIVYELGQDIESKRVPINDNIVYSYRFKPSPDGYMFDPMIGYNQFLQRCEELNDSGDYSYVVIADISDFYHRIYSHRLENALTNATRKNNHVKVIKHLLSGWNETESYGIPVGGTASRLLAEITIADIDDFLRASQITFVRFNDDYRLFAKDKNEAYKNLALLAEILYSNHGLTLQPQKTKILEPHDFRTNYLPTPEEKELDAFQKIFQELINELGLSSNYEAIEWMDLSEEQQESIDSINLENIFNEEIEKGEHADIGVLKFILRRMGQINNVSIADDIFNHLEELRPVFPDVLNYLSSLRNLSEQHKHTLGEKIIDLLQGSILSGSSYHKMWILNMFTNNIEWNNEGKFINLLNTMPDQVCRRKLILALGRAKQSHWFQSRWRYVFDEPPWTRRALLAAGSCMSTDARRHWYDSIEPRLDVLEKAVIKWTRQNPF